MLQSIKISNMMSISNHCSRVSWLVYHAIGKPYLPTRMALPTPEKMPYQEHTELSSPLISSWSWSLPSQNMGLKLKTWHCTVVWASLQVPGLQARIRESSNHIVLMSICKSSKSVMYIIYSTTPLTTLSNLINDSVYFQRLLELFCFFGP